ncbi:hypothetical protein DPMN_188024 [Dreissena polymorpha]|uniref:Uncharacterized protein n=1 Tax=Dreissena polymorpha TaxID=45954 RepID=A0A9D4DQJ5_DREPO|nr:hypothetical protein DPMN_188024 [Dreissena polymorpha]
MQGSFGVTGTNCFDPYSWGRRGTGRWRARPYGRGTYGSNRQAAVTEYGQFGHRHDFKQKKSSTAAPQAPN